MKQMDRRSFLQASVCASAALGVPAIIPSSVLGADAPSNRITLAGIGTGGQGQGNIRNLLSNTDCQVVAMCDVDAHRLKEGVDLVNDHYQGTDCKGYRDFREVIARSDIDAVCISTPDHWHGLITIAAARAGKDIYCEKPLTNTIAEAKAVKEAVECYARVFQTGSHERSRAMARHACELVRNGKIGPLHTMRVNLPTTEPHHLAILADRDVHPVSEPPKELDWDLWLGHTPLVPYTPKRCHFYWRFIMDYGGGEMTDRGAHVIDLGQLGNATDHTTPVEFWAEGEPCQSNLYNAWFNFKFECKYANGVKMIGTHDEPRGIKFIGDEGWVFIHVHDGRLEASDPKLLTIKLRSDEVQLGRSPNHHRNFLDCVKSRRETMAPVHAGYHTAVICHLLNGCMKLGGARFKYDPEAGDVLDNPAARQFLTTPMRAPWHL